jgi:hypothetical protein
MQHARWYWAGLLVLAAALMLLLTISGLAQTATPTESATTPVVATTSVVATTPVATETGVSAATLAPTEQPTVTVQVATTVTATETLTATVEAAATLTPTLVVAEAITTTLPLTSELAVGATTELTIYNQNVGLVKELRTLDLETGENEVRYADIPSGIEPTSVQVVPLGTSGLRMLEQSYEYDLLSTGSLLARYVGRPITLTTQDGLTYTGTLLSSAGDVILSSSTGIRVVRMERVQELHLAELPEGLAARPSLVWLLDADEAGPQDVRVTYLTNGLNWQADYIATLAEDDASLTLSGWMTVQNASGATYENAKLKLVAGDLNRVASAPPMPMLAAKAMDMAAVSPQVQERPFFAYHIYQVERPVTLRDNQTKQIEFISASAISATKILVFDASPVLWGVRGEVNSDPNYGLGMASNVQVRVEFVNSSESGLGLPLPKGVMRVYKDDTDGGADLVGEATIEHTARDERLSLYLGDVSDVIGERTQVAFRKLGERSLEESYEITVRNRQDAPVTVRIIEHLFRAEDAELMDVSAAYTMLNATTFQSEIEVKANGESKLSYTVRYNW